MNREHSVEAQTTPATSPLVTHNAYYTSHKKRQNLEFGNPQWHTSKASSHSTALTTYTCTMLYLAMFLLGVRKKSSCCMRGDTPYSSVFKDKGDVFDTFTKCHFLDEGEEIPSVRFCRAPRGKGRDGKISRDGTGTVRERERLRYFLSRPMFPDLSRY